MTDLTQEEIDAQCALNDARMDVANGIAITPERYSILINRLYRNREQRAKQLANSKTKTTSRSKATPMSDAEMASLFNL